MPVRYPGQLIDTLTTQYFFPIFYSQIPLKKENCIESLVDTLYEIGKYYKDGMKVIDLLSEIEKVENGRIRITAENNVCSQTIIQVLQQ